MDTILNPDFILRWLTDSMVVVSALSVLIALALQISTKVVLLSILPKCLFRSIFHHYLQP